MVEEIFLEGSSENKPENFNGENPQGKPPKKPNGQNPGENTSSISHKSSIMFTQDANLDGQTYSSKESNEHAIWVKGGTVTISNTIITKTGDVEGDSADFYGTNAAIISTDEGILHLANVTVNTDGKHANAVFAYGKGQVDIGDSTITTKADNSGGIMVTGGGILSASNVNITTEGKSSAAIRSDRGGGDIYVEWGKYTTNGVGSPAIYSTANIVVEHAKLTSTKSEGIIIEGKNSVKISNSTLTDTNTTLNGQSATYKNIFLYQSMSGDADEGTASFTAEDSNIITNKGDTIYVTNTKAEIILENNKIINNDGDFLRIEGAAWGKEGSNGGDVNLNLINQKVQGNIVIDNISSLSMTLKEGSSFQGAINVNSQSENISIELDSTSTWSLTSDSYISSLKSDTEGYNNINLNGYTLYIGETAITSVDQIQTEETSTETIENTEISTTNLSGLTTDINPESSGINSNILIIGGIGIIGIIIIICICIKRYIKK